MATTVFSKPWTLMEIVDGYYIGEVFHVFNMDVNDQNFYIKKNYQICLGLYGVYLYRNLSVAFTLGTLTPISVYMIRKEEKDVINYTGNILSIALLACAILDGKNRPHTAVVACFSAAIHLLVAYNKLTGPVKKVWSFTPLVMNSITLYASDDIFVRAVAAQGIYEFGQPYFSPQNYNGRG